MARSCNDCFHDCVCPHLSDDDAEKCGAYITDVAPVVHARWIIKENVSKGYKECSWCGYCFARLYPDNYCPNCGAKMDETS